MKIKYICLLTLLLCSRHFLYAQTDTNEVYIAKDFTTYTSFLQFSLGNNLPIGAYGSSKHPFNSSFASAAEPTGICVNAKYVQKLKNHFGLEVGIGFFRNRFKPKDFAIAYIKETGDSVGPVNPFLYEHFNVFFGGNYNIAFKDFLLSANIGMGVLYTKRLGKDGEGEGVSISKGVNSSANSFKGGSLYIPKSYMPMFYSGVAFKYNLGNEFFITGNCDFIYSLYRIELIEEGWRIPRTTYLKTNLSITNLACSVGLGTLF